MVRLADIFLSLLGLIFFAPIFAFLFIIGFFVNRSPLFFQKRLGRNEKLFNLVKFRTMHKSTISTASHLVSNSCITPYGSILRITKLDELPQLWNVLKGDMSLVGPRPCLPQQIDLIEMRRSMDLFRVRPGITGLSQISNINMSDPELLTKKDAEMLVQFNLNSYFKIIILTFLGKGFGDAAGNN